MLFVEEISAGYIDDVDILHGISMTVPESQIVSVIGPNGSGKSTLLRVICGFLPPTRGRVRYRDQILTGLPGHAMAELGICYLPQERSVFPQLSIERNIRLGGWSFRQDGKRLRQALEQIYQRFPMLAERRNSKANVLSGGMQKILEIARGLISDPRLLILDEPTVGLAPKVAKEIYATLDQLRQQTHGAELSAEERQAILAIGENLPGVWHAPTTTMADRKHLLRLVVKDIIVDRTRCRGTLWFQINWHSGASSVHELTRYHISYAEYVDGDLIEQRLRQLHAEHQTDTQIAATLTAEGFQTTRGHALHAKTIGYLRKRWGLVNVKLGAITSDRLRWNDGAYTIRGVMKALSVSKETVHRWRKEGRLQGNQLGPYMPWHFTLIPQQIQRLRAQPRT